MAVRTARTALPQCRATTNGWNSRQLVKYRQMLVSLTTSYDKCILSGNVPSRVKKFPVLLLAGEKVYLHLRNDLLWLPSYYWDTTMCVLPVPREDMKELQIGNGSEMRQLLCRPSRR